MTLPSLFYREIPLSKGQVAIVDVEDYEEYSKHKWHSRWSHTTKSFYAARDITVDGNAKHLYMHLELLGVSRGGDHKNNDTLDNRRDNLRRATHGQNTRNRKRPSHNSTGYKGVTAEAGKYRARIMVDHKSISLGMYREKRAAAIAYNEGALKYHGEFANLNQIA